MERSNGCLLLRSVEAGWRPRAIEISLTLSPPKRPPGDFGVTSSSMELIETFSIVIEPSRRLTGDVSALIAADVMRDEHFELH